MTLGDVADILGCDLSIPEAIDEGVSSLSALDMSVAGDITFFTNKRHNKHLATARATACITTVALSANVSKTGIIAILSSNPRADFAKLSKKMVSEGVTNSPETILHQTASVHPSAVIGSGVSIGAGSQIGANCVIGDGVQIGMSCVIESLVSISFAHIGDRCRIKSGAIIGGAGFGMVKDKGRVLAIPHLGRVIIGNDVDVGSNSCIDRGQLGDTIISNYVKMDNQVQVGHNTTIGEGTIIAGQAGISGSCKIGKNVVMAGRASMADHIEIGDGATLAVNSLAVKDVPAGEVYFGFPATPIREQMRSLIAFKKLADRK